MGKIEEFRPKDSEKITINLGFVDLGHIDLLVQEGFYSNRTDFIRAAIRNQLDRQNDAVKQSVARRHLDLGMRQVQSKGPRGRATGLVRRFTSKSSDWLSLQLTYLPNSHEKQSPPFTCSAPCRPRRT